MLVICAGMCRSGSTWQYQVAGHLLERSGPGERLGFLTPPEFDRALAAPSTHPWRIVKTHDGHPTFATALASGTARCLYSYRDLRDVAHSLAHKWSVSLRTAVIDRVGVRNCIANHAFWTAQPRVFVQRYEDWVANPSVDVTRIASHLGIELQPGEADEIARRFDLEENSRRTAQLAAQLRSEGIDLTDPRNTLLSDSSTLLHWNHIRSGEVGGWRSQSTPDELALLARECGSWLAENGYEQDPVWASLADSAKREAETAQLLQRAESKHAEAIQKLADSEQKHADAEQRALDLSLRLQHADAALASMRETNETLHLAVARLRQSYDDARRTLDGSWSCLPHRIVRWLRAKLAAIQASVQQRHIKGR